MLEALRRRWWRRRLRDPAYAFLAEPPPPLEWVSLDCETTGLDPRVDEIVSIGAVRIVGRRLLTSQRLELLVRPTRPPPPSSVRVHRLRQRDVAQGLPATEAVRRLLQFVGSRPLVGYYIDFDVAMLDRVVLPMLGVRLPQQRVEVSALYHDHHVAGLPALQRDQPVDLRFATIVSELGLPVRDAHDAVNDAVMAGLVFVKLQALAEAGQGPARMHRLVH